MTRLIILFSLFYSFSLFSQDCPSFNLYNNKDNFFKDIPIKNQGFTGMCYAVTTSDAVNYHLNKKGIDYKSSPFWVAFGHKKNVGKVHWKPGTLDYSLLSWAYKNYLETSNCSLEISEEILSQASEDTGVSTYNITKIYELFWKYRKKKKKSFKSLIPRFHAYIQEKFNEKFSITENQILKIIDRFPYIEKAQSLFDFYQNSLFKNCENHKSLSISKKNLPKIKSSNRIAKSYEEQEENLLSLLEQHQNAPTMLGYCSNIVRTPNYRVPLRLPGLSLATSTACSPHYSLIVGSRKNHSTNQCEILVRNSYGTKYWANGAYQCYCQNNETNQKYNCDVESFNPKKEKVLGCWIPSLDLAANTFETNYFLKN